MAEGEYLIARRRWFVTRLRIKVPEHIRAELRDPQLEEETLRFLELLRGKIKVLTLDLKETVNLLRTRAERKGIRLRRTLAPHKRGFCAICVGKQSLHYPYFRKVTEGKTKSEFVTKKELKGILTLCNFTPQEIKGFFLRVDIRHDLIRLYHYTLLYLSRIGVLPEEVEESLLLSDRALRVRRRKPEVKPKKIRRHTVPEMPPTLQVTSEELVRQVVKAIEPEIKNKVEEMVENALKMHSAYALYLIKKAMEETELKVVWRGYMELVVGKEKVPLGRMLVMEE